MVAAAARLGGVGGQRRRYPAQTWRGRWRCSRWAPDWSRCSLSSIVGLPRRCCRPAPFGPARSKWIYLTLGVLMAATMVDMYVPLFGQRLAHLMPVAAGFLGAGLAIGWTVGEISSASLRSNRG